MGQWMGRADLLSHSEAIAEKKTVNGIVIAACSTIFATLHNSLQLQLHILLSLLHTLSLTHSCAVCVCECVCVCISQRHQKVFCINSRFMHSMFAEVPHSPFAPPSRADALPPLREKSSRCTCRCLRRRQQTSLAAATEAASTASTWSWQTWSSQQQVIHFFYPVAEPIFSVCV